MSRLFKLFRWMKGAVGRRGEKGGVGQASSKPKSPPTSLRAFQQSDPTYCLLRIYQGLYRAGAGRVNFTFSPRQITVEASEFHSTAQTDSLEVTRLLTALEQVSEDDQELDPLVAGLWSAALVPSSGYIWEWGGRVLVNREGQLSVSETVGNKKSLRFSITREQQSDSDPFLERQMEFGEKFAFSPTPVYVNGLQVNRTYPGPRRKAWYTHLSLPFLLVYAHGPRGEELGQEFESVFSLYCDELHGHRSCLFIDPAFQEPGVIYPIIDGITSQGLELPHAPGCLAFFDIEDRDVHWSGLSLASPEEVKEHIVGLYKECLSKVLQHPNKISPLFPDSLKRTKELCRGVVSYWDGIFYAPLVPFVAGAEVLVNVGTRVATKRSRKKELREGLERRIRSFLTT